MSDYSSATAFDTVTFKNSIVSQTLSEKGKNKFVLKEPTCITLYETNLLLPTLGKKKLKTLWEKEKMLVTSIFSFSHNIFIPIKDKNHHFKYFYEVLQMF